MLQVFYLDVAKIDLVLQLCVCVDLAFTVGPSLPVSCLVCECVDLENVMQLCSS
jgi:hypothetical protein